MKPFQLSLKISKLSKGLAISLFKRWVPVLIAAVFFAIGFLIMLDQKLSFGLWFQIKDLHHETFAIAAAAVGIGVLIGSLVTEENKATVAKRFL